MYPIVTNEKKKKKPIVTFRKNSDVCNLSIYGYELYTTEACGIVEK